MTVPETTLPDEPTPPCDDIPGIKLIRRIHVGEFGQVWEAQAEALGIRRAVKFPEGALADGQLEEAQRMAAVRNDRLVGVVAAGRCDQGRIPYIVLEWMDGGSLEATVLKFGPLDLRSLYRVGADLAEALEAVHLAGMVHGDVSAQNTMFDSNDHQRRRGHLNDFGASIILRGDRAGLVQALNLRFAAPEMLGYQVEQASDVWGLAVTLWFAGSLTYPFAQIDDLDRLREELQRPHRTPPADWPDGLVSLISACLSRNPLERPSAGDVRRRLEELMDASEENPGPIPEPEPPVQEPDSPAVAAPDSYEQEATVTFVIEVRQSNGQLRTGSGVLVAEDPGGRGAIVATTATTVKEARNRISAITLIDNKGRRRYGELLSYHMGFTLNLRRGYPGIDLAFVRISDPPGRAPDLVDELPPIASDLKFVGNGGGHRFNYSKGVVRNYVAKDGDLPDEGTATWIMHSAPMGPGDTGSPVFDTSGRLVGLNSWTQELNSEFNYALPAGYILKELDQLVTSILDDELGMYECCLACGRRALVRDSERGVGPGELVERRSCEVCGSIEHDDVVEVGFTPVIAPPRSSTPTTIPRNPTDDLMSLWSFPSGMTTSLAAPDGSGVRSDRDDPNGLVAFIKGVVLGPEGFAASDPGREYWQSLGDATDELRIVRLDPFTPGTYSIPGVGPISLVHAAAFLVGACTFYVRNARLDLAQHRELIRLRRQRIQDVLARGGDPGGLGEYPDGPALISELGVLAYRVWAMCGPDGQVPEGFVRDISLPTNPQATYAKNEFRLWHDVLLTYLEDQDRRSKVARDTDDPHRGYGKNMLDLGNALRARDRISRRVDQNQQVVLAESALGTLAAMDGWLTAMAMTLRATSAATGVAAGGDLGAQAVADGRLEIQGRQQWVRQDIQEIGEYIGLERPRRRR